MRALMSVLAIAVSVLVASVAAQSRPANVTTPRLYVFEGGYIRGLDTKLFGFERSEIKEPNFIIISYLVVHPKGTLMWDAGGVPDADFKDGTVAEGVITSDKPLKPQLAAVGYTPADIDYLGLSHYHSDHTANANDFTNATWIVQKAERDAMFAGPVAIMRPSDFAKLKDAKTKLLDNEDFDVFGDGTVIVKPAPGHTPGHQMLYVKLAKRGPVVLSGDLYHYPEERTTGRLPTFEHSPAVSRVTRPAVEAFVEQTGAELWIEHDIATHAALPKAPAYVE